MLLESPVHSFIKRGKGAIPAIESIAQSLSDGQAVVIFPEGTTTEGLDVIRFQPRLFQAAIDAKKPVQPLSICYKDSSGAIQTEVSYSGNKHFMQSLWAILCLQKKFTEICLLEAVSEVKSRDLINKHSENEIRKSIKT